MNDIGGRKILSAIEIFKTHNRDFDTKCNLRRFKAKGNRDQISNRTNYF